MKALATSTKRTLATLVAWLSLLCVQLTALPSLDAPTSQPSVVTAPAQAVIARPQGILLLVKADKSPSLDKQSPGIDMLVIGAAARLSQPVDALLGTPLASAGFSGSTRRTHQARAPPVASHTDRTQLTIIS